MTMMSAIVARINNPMIPRAIFGVLNTLLYFPSGAIYPVEALPWWLRAITRFDPFTYAIDGFRGLLLKRYEHRLNFGRYRMPGSFWSPHADHQHAAI